MAAADYNKRTIDHGFFLKRFSHRRRFMAAADLLGRQKVDSVLDYGSGNGHFARLLKEHYPGMDVACFEPVPRAYKALVGSVGASGAIRCADDIKAFEGERFDAITCLEVLEHLAAPCQEAAMRDIKSLLVGGGVAVISIPIETGLSSLAKNVIRILSGERNEAMTAGNIMKSAAGTPVERREANGHIASHMGFDYRPLEGLFERCGFKVQRRMFSPFRRLPAMLNSQVFYVLRRRGAGARPGR